MRPRLPRLPKIDGNSLERGSASASARISVEIRIVPSGKRGGVRITDNATESRLKLQLVHLTECDLLAELTDVALQLVAEVADAVAELHSLLGVLIRQTTNSILKVVEVHGIAQTCLSDRLAIRTTTSIPASAEHEQEQHDNLPCTVAAPAIAVIVATSDSGDVRRAHVFRFVLLS